MLGKVMLAGMFGIPAGAGGLCGSVCMHDSQSVLQGSSCITCGNTTRNLDKSVYSDATVCCA